MAVSQIICSHEYKCMNRECDVTTIAETFDGFLNIYSRMAVRKPQDYIIKISAQTT